MVSVQTFPPVIGVGELAILLGKTPATVFADRCRAPHKIPPACTPPGAKAPRWIVADVIVWLRQHQESAAQSPPNPTGTRGPGRPTKFESLRGQAARGRV